MCKTAPSEPWYPGTSQASYRRVNLMLLQPQIELHTYAQDFIQSLTNQPEAVKRECSMNLGSCHIYESTTSKYLLKQEKAWGMQTDTSDFQSEWICKPVAFLYKTAWIRLTENTTNGLWFKINILYHDCPVQLMTSSRTIFHHTSPMQGLSRSDKHPNCS